MFDWEGRGGENDEIVQFFFSGPSKFNSSKMERKLGENRWVDGIIYLPLILPHNNIINSTLCIFFF